MKEVSFIDLGFENCEVVTFKKEHVGVFRVTDIKKSVGRIALNSISEMYTCEELMIQISSKANTQDSFSLTFDEGKVLPFERLSNHEDVVSVGIHYEDGSELDVYAKWGGNSDYQNPHQTSEIHETTGDFYLCISDTQTVKEVFKDYLSNNKNSFWEAYSITAKSEENDGER